jgi:hypothetical protein
MILIQIPISECKPYLQYQNFRDEPEARVHTAVQACVDVESKPVTVNNNKVLKSNFFIILSCGQLNLEPQSMI